MKPYISIYISCPFYDSTNDQLTKAYITELESFKRIFEGKRIRSIYFAGTMPIKVIEKLFKYLDVDKNAETSIEIAPTLDTWPRLKDLKDLGINRVSIAAQTLSKEAITTIESANKVFDNYSFDLTYARPAQTLKAWQEELNHALNYIRHHVSLNQFISGSDHELEAEMFKLNREILESNGIYQYEISNYAVPGKESVHSLAYYNYDEYLGIGPGAQSRVMIDGRMVAISIEDRPQSWLERPAREEERLSDKQVAYEYIMMNLRKANGFSRNDFYIKFNKDIYRYLDRNALKLFQTNGWLQYTEERVFVTRNGRIFLDKIVRDVIKDDEY